MMNTGGYRVRGLVLAALLLAVFLASTIAGNAQGSGAKLMADGQKALSAGSYDEAVDSLSKAIKSGSLAKPDMAGAFVARGQALQGKGSHARAVADFTNALWLESLSSADTARALALRGTSRQALGQTKAASDDFKKAEAAQPGVTAQLGGAASAAAGAPAVRRAGSSSGSGDGEGFFDSLFGGASGDAGAEPASARSGTRVATAQSGTRVATARGAPAQAPSRNQAESESVGGFLSGLFGGEDEAPRRPAPEPIERAPTTRVEPLAPTPAPASPQAQAGPRRLLQAEPQTQNRQRVAAASNSATAEPTAPESGGGTRLLGDILDPEAADDGPAQPAASRVRVVEDAEEPGFFERIFGGGSRSEVEPVRTARAEPRTAPRLKPASESPDAWTTRSETAAARQPARQGPVTQRDSRLPTFVNQPGLTDRILGNEAVEPSNGGATRLAAVDARRTPVAAARPARPTVAVTPAEYDWARSTRVERGPQPGPVVRRTVAAPPLASPVARPSAPAVRRPAAAPPQAAAPQPAPASQRAPAPPPAPGSRPTLGSQVAGAVDWLGNQLAAVGEQVTTRPRVAPAPRQAAPQQARPAPARQTARTEYRPAASPSGYVLQLAARQQRRDAEVAARSAEARHGRLFGGAKPFITQADVPGKGRYYRVRVGPYRTRDQVASLCAQLKSRGQDCFVARN